MGFSLTVDKDVEIHVDARIKITSPKPPGEVIVTATSGGIVSTHSGATKMSFTLPADKQIKLGISYVDANGNPAQVDGAIAWETSDAAVCYLETLPVQQGATGSVVMLKPGTKVGAAQVSAQADADLGEGVAHIVTLMDITVVGGAAVAGTIAPVGELEPLP